MVVHGILVFGTTLWLLKPLIEEEKDIIVVELIDPLPRRSIPKKLVRSVEEIEVSPAHLQKIDVRPQYESSSSGSSSLIPLPDFTVVDLTPDDTNLVDSSPDIDRGGLVDSSPDMDRGSSETKNIHHGQGVDRRNDGEGKGLGDFPQSSRTGQDAFGGKGAEDIVGTEKDQIGEELGSVIDEEDGIIRGHIRLIRLKHDMSDWWQDPTAIPSLIKWLRDHAPTITADMDYEGGALPLTDKKIMEAPLIIMTGHDQAMSVSYQPLADRNSQTSGFSKAERAALRKYILDHNGMLFFDYCGNGGNEKSFARLVENELRIVFPEYPLTTLNDMRHDIFQAYFKLTKTPIGGSTFWGTGYKGGNDKWRYMKGMAVPGRSGKNRLGVIFGPLDYLCSMEIEAIDSRAPLSTRRSSDVYRFMTNMFVYQMRQRAKSDNN